MGNVRIRYRCSRDLQRSSLLRRVLRCLTRLWSDSRPEPPQSAGAGPVVGSFTVCVVEATPALRAWRVAPFLDVSTLLGRLCPVKVCVYHRSCTATEIVPAAWPSPHCPEVEDRVDAPPDPPCSLPTRTCHRFAGAGHRQSSARVWRSQSHPDSPVRRVQPSPC